jgi:hypothetical protein
VLGKEEVAPSGKDKTSLLVVAKHEAGALFDLLSQLFYILFPNATNAHTGSTLTGFEANLSRRTRFS